MLAESPSSTGVLIVADIPYNEANEAAHCATFCAWRLVQRAERMFLPTPTPPPEAGESDGPGLPYLSPAEK